MPKKSKKTKEKEKFGKKFRKRKSKSKKRSGSSRSEVESTDDEQSSEFEWTEKSAPPSPPAVAQQRDQWMSESLFIATHSNCVSGTKKKKKKEEEEEAEKQDRSRRQFVEPGRTNRELNPYWKDGGCGLPGSDDRSELETIAVAAAAARSSKDCGEASSNFANYVPSGTGSSRGWRKMNTSESCRAAEKETQRPNAAANDAQSEPVSLTEEELNSLASKILRAKIMKNDSLVKELTEKLENARRVRDETKRVAATSDCTVLLTYTNARGAALPVRGASTFEDGAKKRRKYQTHVDGERVRYFEDDDKYSLSQMYEKEMSRTSADHNAEFVRLFMKSGGGKNRAVEDVYPEQSTTDRTWCRENDEDLRNAISREKRTQRALDSCQWCLTNARIPKHLIVSTRSKCYLSLPSFQPLTEGHCIIAPVYHSTCSTLVDEDVWEEILTYCKELTQVWRTRQQQDVVFFELATNFKRYPHMRIQCVPVPFDSGALVPIYFKKAILESEKEWARNKKLIDVRKFDVRRVVPRGLPYFMVSFGIDYGFAHVIEDEKDFPNNFAQEVIGGMLDLDHRIWRKELDDDFENQCKRANKFRHACAGTELLESRH